MYVNLCRGGVFAFMSEKNRKPAATSGTAGVIAIVVVGIFMLCTIFLIAKGLFSSNSKEVPDGVNTGTINTDVSVPVNSTEPVTEVTEQKPADQSQTETAESAADEPQGEQMYVLDYAYLHVSPDNDSENIICMSPGVQVTLLGEESNGYVKITFQNVDGPLTGYVYKDYLTTEYVQPAWQN